VGLVSSATTALVEQSRWRSLARLIIASDTVFNASLLLGRHAGGDLGDLDIEDASVSVCRI